MTRTAKPDFHSFDPDVLEAARDVARRAGIPLEEWIARNVPQGGPRRRRPGDQPRKAERAAEEAGRFRPGRPQGAADTRRPFAAGDADEGALAALMARLDGLDRNLADERRAAETAASRRLEEIEHRLTRALDAGAAPVEKVTERLGDIERRMSELGDKVAAARPYPRRGRGPAEMREAVEEIRQRQRALGEHPVQPRRAADEPNVVAGMRRDLARRLDAGLHEDLMIDTAEAVSQLQRETLRLRESIGGLATSRDVGALEQAMISLATNVERAQPSADLVAITAPIESIREHVERLAGEVADNVHGRVADEVTRLAARLDSVAAAGPGSDGRALDTLFQELDEIRRLLGTLAGPERIQSLAQGMQAISAQIAQLQEAAREAAKADDSATLRPLLEEIRSGLGAPAPAAFIDQMRAMATKLDALHERAGGQDPAESRRILGRIDALADKVEQASTRPVDDLIGRLEGLSDRLGEQLGERAGEGRGDGLRGGALTGDAFASIQAMLSNLAEKVDRVGDRAGDRAGSDGLDALEKQVLTLAKRLESRGADPALTSLERSMGDLLAQVAALREQAPDADALERAAREAVSAGLADRAGPQDRGEIGLLRAGLADLQARQSASDQRLGAMLDGVQSALDRLMSRLDPAAEPGSALAAGPRPPSLDEQLMASTAADLARGEAERRRRPEMKRAAPAAHPSDELLEPGAGRPQREVQGRTLPEAGPRPARGLREEPAAGDDGAGDIKTSFIAAARRAAQAAQAELASEAASERRDLRLGARLEKPGIPGAAPAGGRLARLRAEIDRRRRPILLGLAAIVLALGALQAIGTHMAEPDPSIPAPRAAAAPEPARSEATAEAAKPEAPKPEAPKPEASKSEVPKSAASSAERAAEAPKTALADPLTTQAIPSDPAAPPAPGRARSGPPRISAAVSLSGDLSGLPAGLAKLRQAVLDGDGAAAWELAARAADGRGLTRDLALAAKLFEKLASAGYAPAQYKLGGHYEKGSGVVRDLAQAKLWYGRAAEQGHARSMHNLAVIYAESPGANGKPDYASAASWFRQGAEYGLRDSQYNLGVLYARGLGLGQDLVQSYVWFSAAAAQGDEDAGRKRDDVANKLGPADLASAKTLAATFKPRKLDPVVNEPPQAPEGGGAMTLLGAPAPSAPAFTPASRARGV
ncbi:hypothetical protein BHAOGJBA_1645 [Methylobacterium hispanicum]|jgi:localization factor PodJL|uniref:Localization factor PodJL n=3 Tax=Methylobacterium TaxID=407 RepID=A0AAV4ZIH2_9HYPH|nr:hypothetical protein [Methylobacterium hispanicum]GJD88133.1 hypothetical protein BHAOGJBA_1645 [Methylobacterium hispanicum]